MTVASKSFGLSKGDMLTWRYEVVERIGAGAEGEVYKIRECATGLMRAAKLYFRSRKFTPKRFARYARKLDALRDCDIVIKYLHAEEARIGDSFIYCLISEYFSGVVLEDMLHDYRGKRMPAFEALNLIHALVVGLEEIHARNEFHGDLHKGNIFIERNGVFFRTRTIDFHDWGRTAAEERRADILSVARLLYDIVGGKPHYRKQPPAVRDICLGKQVRPDSKKVPEHISLARAPGDLRMVKDIALRRMTPDDAGDLIAAFDALLPDDWRDGPLPDAARMEEVLADKRLIVIAAFDEKTPAGYVSGVVMPALHRDGSVAMLDDLLVFESFRNEGLGRRLVEAFKRAAKEIAASPVSMWSGTGVDNIACQKAFAAAGGKPVDETYTEYEWERLD